MTMIYHFRNVLGATHVPRALKGTAGLIIPKGLFPGQRGVIFYVRDAIGLASLRRS